MLVTPLAAAPQIPNYVDPDERLSAPELSTRTRLRFLTTVDFPPFNFLDQSQRLAGFNVDLARAICEVLEALEVCQIQALPWTELELALTSGQGEAIIAGTAVTAETRNSFRFTRPYLELPARFVVPDKMQSADAEVIMALDGKRVGVIAGSAHEAMLRSWFPALRPVTFERLQWAHDALREDNVDALFADGVQLSFWLQSRAAAGCCRFLGGPYRSAHFLGEGLAIAVAPEDKELAAAFDHALWQLNRNGRFAELYLRWFPAGLY
ncbi:transporter substrate-binding domain-containing protein [Pseudohoeflea coraliihabitans]|uniref:Transporter substrate-binding domain-containing protein n=1 Tax=Pseudohoeflea coraliihabitans TaxID=2860393 RepID=A0ABS6WR01_9HYPH|nr:transporter substrate-binding domain-containing protein [Pseudohoeflea sp. DP4N28-3]MBW3097469.1 transporter substrate-binding domain-containing protein [Pseudohoeflea sp. DP4N28-3]